MRSSSAQPPPRRSGGHRHTPSQASFGSSENRYAPRFDHDRSRRHGPFRDAYTTSRSSSRYDSSSRNDERGLAQEGTGGSASAAAAAVAIALASEPIIEKMVPIMPSASGHVLDAQQLQQEKEEQKNQICTMTTSSSSTEAAVAAAVAASSPPQPPPAAVNAALVARQGALKSGYLWKMGANVPRWKRRFFVLKPITMLFYYMSEHDTEPRGCIDLDLFDAVRKVREDFGDASTGNDGLGLGSSKDRAAGLSAPTAASASTSSSSSKRRRNSPRPAAAAASGSTSTAFELYRTGCPDGSGFMLEARGGEDWEEWVESIANGRHSKMRAEMDVMKGANKVMIMMMDDTSMMMRANVRSLAYYSYRPLGCTSFGVWIVQCPQYLPCRCCLLLLSTVFYSREFFHTSFMYCCAYGLTTFPPPRHIHQISNRHNQAFVVVDSHITLRPYNKHTAVSDIIV